jgi:hypothetical protein
MFQRYKPEGRWLVEMVSEVWFRYFSMRGLPALSYNTNKAPAICGPLSMVRKSLPGLGYTMASWALRFGN